jgi:outer membrane protein assembly factor BamB
MLRIGILVVGILSISQAFADEAKVSTTLLPDGKVVVGQQDAKSWIARRDHKGNLAWEKSVGENGRLNVLAVLNNGSFVAAGTRNLFLGPAWAVGLDANGKILWERNFGKASFDAAAIIALPDGSVVLAGNLNSSMTSARWAIRLNANGKIIWRKTFDRKDEQGSAYAIALLPKDDVIVAGQRWEDCGCESYHSGDPWAARLDKRGELVWMKAFGTDLKFDAAQDTDNEDNYFVLRSAKASGNGGSVLRGDNLLRINAKVTHKLGTWILRLDHNGAVVVKKYSKVSKAGIP